MLQMRNWMGLGVSQAKHVTAFRCFREIAGDTLGQDLVEYGLLASLIAVASVGAVSVFGISVSELWSRMVADLSGYFS